MTRTNVAADDALAERAGAADEVVRLLRSLPLGDYDNVGEVVRSLDTTEATGQDRSDQAARQLVRSRTQGMVAEHERDAGTTSDL